MSTRKGGWGDSTIRAGKGALLFAVATFGIFSLLSLSTGHTELMVAWAVMLAYIPPVFPFGVVFNRIVAPPVSLTKVGGALLVVTAGLLAITAWEALVISPLFGVPFEELARWTLKFLPAWYGSTLVAIAVIEYSYRKGTLGRSQ